MLLTNSLPFLLPSGKLLPPSLLINDISFILKTLKLVNSVLDIGAGNLLALGVGVGVIDGLGLNDFEGVGLGVLDGVTETDAVGEIVVVGVTDGDTANESKGVELGDTLGV